MAFDREAAKQAGYSDDEINAYMQAEAEKNKTEAPAPVVADVGEPPAPTTVVKPIESTPASVTTAAGIGLAPYAVPAVGAAAAALGGKALYNRWDQSAKAAQALADAKLASEQGIAQRFEQRMAQQAGQALPKPVAPSPILDAAGRPMTPSTGPVVPQAPAPVAQGAQMAEQAAARAPSLLDKTTNMVRQLAASKVFDTLAKGATGLQLATYSPELGPKTPQVGRMRGMEINPMTGRPWTPDQIKAYTANPAMFDTALGQAQMPR